MYQNEHGTWPREDMADHTPPLEKYQWWCPPCWQRICELAEERRLNVLCLAERVPDVAALELKSGVCCAVCDKPLAHEKDVYREVY